jgi:hypothetical protein
LWISKLQKFDIEVHPHASFQRKRKKITFQQKEDGLSG